MILQPLPLIELVTQHPTKEGALRLLKPQERQTVGGRKNRYMSGAAQFGKWPRSNLKDFWRTGVGFWFKKRWLGRCWIESHSSAIGVALSLKLAQKAEHL